VPRQSTDEKLALLEALVEDADAQALPAVLGQALAVRNYRIVAYAAHVAGEKLVYDCVPQLLAAYPHFLEKPVKRDPVCAAKKAIMRALYDLDCDDVEFYLAAIRYRQMEPVWGGTVDTATDLRSSAAMGLVSSGYSRALLEVAELLTDSEPPVIGDCCAELLSVEPDESVAFVARFLDAGDEARGDAAPRAMFDQGWG
jgi:hypothetical protein